MNKVNDEVLQRVLNFIDFSNIENSKKKEYNKRDKFKNRKNWQDDKDILTQMTLLFYNNLEHKPTTIIQSQENLEIQRENIKLLKENEQLKNEVDSYKNTRKQNIRNRKIIDDLHEEIHNLKLKITTLQSKINYYKTDDISVVDEVFFDYTKVKDSNEPTTLSDFTNHEIYYASECETVDKWNSYSEIEKINKLEEYRKV